MKAATVGAWRAIRRRVAIGLKVPALFGVAVGCSPSAPSRAQPDAQIVCPATVADAIGKPCALEGLDCFPEYQCGILPVIARCNCSAGTFSCTDATGAVLADPDAAPACPPAPTSSTSCPSTEPVSGRSQCNQAGLLCSYFSRCLSERKYDQCQCFLGATEDGAVTLRFQCSPSCSDAGMGLPEASTDASLDTQADVPSDGTVDGFTDALADAPVDSVAPRTDASTDAHATDGPAE